MHLFLPIEIRLVELLFLSGVFIQCLLDRVQRAELSPFEFWKPLNYNLQSKSNTIYLIEWLVIFQ